MQSIADDPCMEDAIDAAMVQVPMLGEHSITREECALVVRAAVATYLHGLARQIGKQAGLSFEED